MKKEVLEGKVTGDRSPGRNGLRQGGGWIGSLRGSSPIYRLLHSEEISLSPLGVQETL